MRLHLRISLTAVLLAAVAVSVFAVSAVEYMRRLNIKHIRSQFHSHLDLAVGAIENHHRAAWTDEIDKILRTHEEFRCWELRDSRGQLLARSRAEGFTPEDAVNSYNPAHGAGRHVLRRGQLEVIIAGVDLPEQSETGTIRVFYDSGFGVLPPAAHWAMLGISAGAILLILVPMVVLIRHWVIRPIAQLTCASKSLAAGKADEPLPSAGHDEVGELVFAFGEMAKSIRERDAEIGRKVAQLQRSRDELEGRVQQRTKDLQRTNDEMVREIRRREIADQQLRASREQYLSLFENCPVGLYRARLSQDGEILLANEAFARIFGFASAEDAMGESFATLHDDPWRRAEIFARLRDEHSIQGEQVRMRRQDGSLIWCVLTKRVGSMTEDGGWYDGMVLDVTAQVTAQENLHKTLEELEQFNRLAVGRELRMIELKREVNAAASAGGRACPYDLSFADECVQGIAEGRQ